MIDYIARHCDTSLEGLQVGIGDDAAVLRPPPGRDLALCTDTLVEAVHFFPDDPPGSIGHRALAVNLSDLAAMGAEPAWSLLALTMPRADQHWVEQFVTGFTALARRHRVALLGGDLCRGPLGVTVQAGGWLPRGQAMTRSGSRPGDAVYVSGNLGEAAAAVALIGAG
ncbi:MAG: thiamine-monophosphate kinase, partial [Gammaproteobacteria bacterium]